ncbi:M14 metallopeptidase family protein [Myroides phaeus]|uniref:M14 family metallopeptidase n=1 Tax=Myroides phaeus TaxID=702745 RepID=UPI001303CF66|nr:M14 metallopeptidase family protein [Myroides phaeus]
MNYQYLVEKYTYHKISGRYITSEKIASFLNDLKDYFKVEVKGKSVEGRDIKTVTWGEGPTKIFMWSQMHGNESTTTKAVLDLLNLLNEEKESFIADWKKRFTFLIVPILNIDGAHYYTRVNANQVDLNRDSINLTQPESQLLRKLFEDFKPDYAFNLHDQRTIFGVGDQPMPATISFLAPSYNEEREINANREKAIKLIVAMNQEVQKVIPGQVGRFDDGFNINCIGDYFQSQGVPTILFEAGHYQNDYNREKTREIVFLSLLSVICSIFTKNYENNSIESYLSIPENQKSFNDVAIGPVSLAGSKEEYIVKIQYLEQLKNNNVKFCPIIVDIIKKESKFAHHYIKESIIFKNSLVKIEDALDKNYLEVVDSTVSQDNGLLNK